MRTGELVALAGENGAGKTSLVRCIAGDVVPASGEVFLAGRRVPADPAAAVKQGIAVVWQDLALCDNLDVAANIMLGRERCRLLMSDTRFHTEAASLLASLRIPLSDTTRNVRALSGGQRQLVAVARAMGRKPRLLVLDEPTASLGREGSGSGRRPDHGPATAGHDDPAGLSRHRPDVPARRPHRGAAPGPDRGRPAHEPMRIPMTWWR